MLQHDNLVFLPVFSSPPDVLLATVFQSLPSSCNRHLNHISQSKFQVLSQQKAFHALIFLQQMRETFEPYVWMQKFLAAHHEHRITENHWGWFRPLRWLSPCMECHARVCFLVFFYFSSAVVFIPIVQKSCCLMLFFGCCFALHFENHMPQIRRWANLMILQV